MEKWFNSCSWENGKCMEILSETDMGVSWNRREKSSSAPNRPSHGWSWISIETIMVTWGQYPFEQCSKALYHSMKYCLVENGIMIANPQWLVDIGWYNPRYVDISFWIMKEFPPLFFGSPMFPQSYALFIHQHDAPVRHGPAQTWHAWPGGWRNKPNDAGKMDG